MVGSDAGCAWLGGVSSVGPLRIGMPSVVQVGVVQVGVLLCRLVCAWVCFLGRGMLWGCGALGEGTMERPMGSYSAASWFIWARVRRQKARSSVWSPSG